jgi:benzoate 4-monooxygenase
VKNLKGIAVAAVRSRIDAAEKGTDCQEDRKDHLARLLQGKDASGERMGCQEVAAEALTQLIASSDTISNTACAIFYWIFHGEPAAPGTIISRLQSELDAAIPDGTEVASYASVKHLPYLEQCIDEGMHLHSTSAIGLPRITVGDAGVFFDMYTFH